MAPVAAIAPVAVQPYHRRCAVEQIVGLDKRDRRRQPGIGLRLVVRHAVAAAEKEIVADEMLFSLGPVEQRDDAQVVGQDVDRIVLGDRQAELEFARQIALTVQRVGRFFVRCHLLAVKPDLVIGTGPRQQVGREPPRIVLELAVHRIEDWHWHGRHSAHDIAARRQ